MIEDKELRDLFKVETEEHLQSLEKGLLRLESDPADAKSLDEVFRDAHSLKGSARMVGVKDIELIGHGIEDLLGKVRKGDAGITAPMIDNIYKAMDAVRKLAQEAVTGAHAGVDVSAVLELMAIERQQGAKSRQAGDASAGPAASIKDEKTEAVPPAQVKNPDMAAQELKEAGKEPVKETVKANRGRLATVREAVKGGAAAVDARKAGPEEGSAHHDDTPHAADTIRVDTHKLDELMTRAGELTVMKTRLNRRFSQVEEILDAWEDAHRSLSAVTQAQSAYGARAATKPAESNNLGKLRSGFASVGTMLASLKDNLYTDSSRFGAIADEVDSGIRDIRLLPFSKVFDLFPRMVREMSRERAKEVRLVIEGADATADKRIIEEIKDPLMHMVRNSIDHSIETPDERIRAGKTVIGTIRLSARRTDKDIIVEVSDDGRGIDTEAVKKAALKRKLFGEKELEAMSGDDIQNLIFLSGFSTSSFITDISGRGVGLDVVRANIEKLKGTVKVFSTPVAGCTFRLTLPVTLATARAMIAKDHGSSYAIPVEFIDTTRLLTPKDILQIEGRKAAVIDGRTYSVGKLSEILGVQADPSRHASYSQGLKDGALTPCLILAAGTEKFGVLVDELTDEQEVVLKPHGALLKRVRNVAGSTILGGGEVCMVLNPRDMLKTLKKSSAAPVAPSAQTSKEARKQAILLVEDSITTRTQEKRILDAAGYEVVTAVNGVDALEKLAGRAFDGVVSDILMPEMDGLTLTARIRQDRRYKELPVILVTTLSTDEDKRRGLDAGANAYIPKPSFDQKMLLETLKRLV